MNPDRNHWPTLAGAAVLVMALLAPGAFGQNDTTDPSPDGNDTIETTGAQGGATDRLSFEAGHAEGRHVSFDLDAATGTVCDWTFEGTLVLSEIRWGDFSGEVRHQGSTVTVHDSGGSSDDVGGSPDDDDAGMDDADDNGSSGDEDSPYQETGNGTEDGGNETDDGNTTGDGNTTDGPTDVPPGNATAENGCLGDSTGDAVGDARDGDSRMMLHDNPIGSIKLETRGPEEITIDVADGFDVAMDGDRVTVTGDGFEARLWKDQDSKESDLAVDGQTVTFGSDSKANILWRVLSPETEGDAELADAVESGHVACEVLVLGDEDVVFESGDDDQVTVSTVRSPTIIDVNIEVDIDVDVDVPDIDDADDATDDATDDGDNATDDGDNATDDDGNTTDDGQTTDNGTGATGDGTPVVSETVHVPVTVLVIDIDATVVVDATVEGLTVLLDGQPVQEAGTVTEVVEAEEATAMVVADADGGLRVVTTAVGGSQVLSLQAEGRAFDAASVPLFGDDSDDVESTSPGDDGTEGSQGDDDGSTDVSVPAPAFTTFVLALLAAAAFALRRKA